MGHWVGVMGEKAGQVRYGKGGQARHSMAEACYSAGTESQGGKYHLESVLGTRSEWVSNDHLNIFINFILNAAGAIEGF